MNFRLYLSLTLAALALTLVAAYSWYSYSAIRGSMTGEFRNEVLTAVGTLGPAMMKYAQGELNAREFDAELDRVLAGSYFERNWIKGEFRPIDTSEGYFPWSGTNEERLMDPRLKRVITREVYEPGLDESDRKAKKRTISLETYPLVESAALTIIDLQGRPKAEIKVFISKERLRMKLGAILRTHLLLAGLSMLMIAGAAYALARRAARPMEVMAGALGRLRHGDFAEGMPEKGLREVRDMAASYNALRGTLEEKARLDQDLLAAREIQMGLLPKEKLDVEGWEVWGMCLPAREVGGDFYFWHTRKNRVYAGVGDVSGKGMRASLLASLSMGSLKTVFRGEGDLEHSFSVLNDILFHEFQGKGFLCMNAATLTGNSGHIELVNAGQSWPILIQDHRTLAYWALENGDLPLGAIREPHYRKDPLVLSEGQGLILYSDGGPEIKNVNGRLLGFDDFLKILQEHMDHDLETWGRRISDALTAWRGEAPQHDDITILFLRFGRK